MKQFEIEAKFAELNAKYLSDIAPFKEANNKLRMKLNELEMSFLTQKNFIKEDIRKNEETLLSLKARYIIARAEISKIYAASVEDESYIQHFCED